MNPYSLVGLRNSGTFLPYSPGPTHAREGSLPIDAKFPHDSFERVVATAKAGNPAEDFFARAEIHLTFFQAVSGVERGQDDRAGCLARWEYGRVWSHNSRPPCRSRKLDPVGFAL
jgi:hypothetical protein